MVDEESLYQPRLAQFYREWRAAWVRGGSIGKIAWIGRDVLAWCSGLHIVFLDMPSDSLKMSALSHESAGASCLSGLATRQIFAYAEKNPKPRIFVYEYPTMKKISQCEKDTSFAYLATAFAGDYLIALGLLPDFRLAIWSWRSGAKITNIDTSIHDADSQGQSLSVSFFDPKFIAQVGYSSGRLLTWDMTTCSDTIILNSNEVILPKKALVKEVAWSPDTNDLLAIIDRDGHIYLSNSKGSEINRIVLSQRCGVCKEYEPPSLCWYRGGIVQRTTFCQIRYYRKRDDNAWRMTWLGKPGCFPVVLLAHPFTKDRVIFASREGHVVQVKFSEETNRAEFVVKHFSGGKYRLVNFVHPRDDHLVAVDESDKLTIIKSAEGAVIKNSEFSMNGNVTKIVSHPDFPLIIACSDQGELEFVSLEEIEQPKVLGKFWLQSEKLDVMKFSISGRYLVVCQKKSGVSYFINVLDSKPVSVITRLDPMVRIADILLFDEEDSLKFYVLQRTSNVAPVGNRLIFYELPSGQREFNKTSSIYSLENNYRHLHYVFSEKNVFLGTPYLTKQLRFFRIIDWKELSCYSVIPNDHQLKQVRIHTSRNWIVTCGLDGSINFRSANVKSQRKTVLLVTHHRRDFGVERAIVNNEGNMLVALGANGSLVAMKSLRPEEIAPYDENLKELLTFGEINVESAEDENLQPRELYSDSMVRLRMKQFLSEPIKPFMNSEQSEELTWNDWIERQKVEEEKQRFSSIKDSIVSEFTNLKNKIKILLENNQSCSELERLPISAFALDKQIREKKMKKAKDEREEVRNRLKYDRIERDQVSDWIKTNFWDLQKVYAQSIFGIFDQTIVTNYAICEETLISPDKLNFVAFYFNVMKELTDFDTIFPWEDYSPAELGLEFDKQLRVKRNDDVEKIDALIDIEEERSIDPEEEKNKLLFDGVTSHLFIEPSTAYYSQLTIYSFSQIMSDHLNLCNDTMRLRHFFNKQFDEMFSMKEREMNLARERIDRVLFVIDELKTMFKDQIEESFTYPEWRTEERPENIIQVLDSELTSAEYISQSHQELLDKQAAEVERLRLERLADDFRERALQAMMDGVLEIRWEDLIKRDVAKPECLLAGTAPDDYTDEDTLAVKRYEQDCKNLEMEREKYRRLLLSDYAKVSASLREGIDRFNSRLVEFHLMKMKVEAATQQLNLRYSRNLRLHVQRLKGFRDNDKLKAEIARKYSSIPIFLEQIKVIKAVEQELHNQLENLLNRDKVMEKKLKTDFPALGKNAFMMINLQYKRRPRIVLKTDSSYEILDLAKSIMTATKLSYLTPECLDYLKNLEQLDHKPANLPASIDDTQWHNLVVLRRMKIHNQLEIRAVELELDQTERALARFNQNVANHRLSIESLREQVKRGRAERLKNELDVELQLVLKMGQLEVDPLLGAAEAIVLPQRELVEVNTAIVDAGARKIKAMQRNLEFTRGIVAHNWQHQCLETRLNHLSTHLYYTRTTTVTREIRQYLSKSPKHKKDEKSDRKIEKEFEITRKGQIKLLEDVELKLDEVKREIKQITERNEKLDVKIMRLNVDRCDKELTRDVEAEAREKNFRDKVVKLLAERSNVIMRLLENYEHLLELRKQRDALLCGGGVPVRFTVLPSESEYQVTAQICSMLQND